MTSELEYHPLAGVFPMLDPKEQMSLSDDIKAHGLRDPIVTHEGMILDGRNRHQACVMAGVEPTFKDFDGSDPLAFVISANLHRRHLNDDQRAQVAAKIATMKQGARTDLSPIGGMSQADAADALNVGQRKVERMVKVRKEGAPELVAAVERGDVSVSAAANIATLPKDEQREIIARGEKAVVEAAKTVRDTARMGHTSDKAFDDEMSDAARHMPAYVAARRAMAAAADGIGRGSIENDQALFDAAKAALGKAHIDEVADIPDKDVQMRMYALQAKDTALIKSAVDIRLRMERRLGQLLASGEAAADAP